MSTLKTNASENTTAAAEAPESPHHFDGHRLPWPDAVGLTALIAFWGMLSAGWFDPMLPWVK